MIICYEEGSRQKRDFYQGRNEKREGSGSIAGHVFRLQVERLSLGYTREDAN